MGLVEARTTARLAQFGYQIKDFTCSGSSLRLVITDSSGWLFRLDQGMFGLRALWPCILSTEDAANYINAILDPTNNRLHPRTEGEVSLLSNGRYTVLEDHYPLQQRLTDQDLKNVGIICCRTNLAVTGFVLDSDSNAIGGEAKEPCVGVSFWSEATRPYVTWLFNHTSPHASQPEVKWLLRSLIGKQISKNFRKKPQNLN